MKLSDLKAQVAAAQERMGLADWKLTVRWAAEGEMGKDNEAEIGIDSLHEREATIVFEKPKRGETVRPAVVFHELGHIYFAPFYIPPNDLNEERACWAIAHALERG